MTTGRPSKSTFIVLITGQIETAEFPEVDNLYCKYTYVFGPDWRQVSGLEEGLSPTCDRGRQSQRIVFNTPLEATFTSTNPFRWPQLVLSCYGHDRFGNDVIRGYGATYVPTIAGRTTRKVAMFVPQASTLMQNVMSFFTGRRAEFVDPRIVAMSQGREVTRVTTQGFITVSFNVVLKDLKKFGYDTAASTIGRFFDAPLPNFEEEFQRAGRSDAPQPPASIVEEPTEVPLTEEAPFKIPRLLPGGEAEEETID
ncbi:hypothetical protein M3Y99_00036800 [Aphelenchoides fujianensis]|nr:hypothetical protein M3Y99_00036800 [Aphelenchoides fujianensis]